MFYFRMKLYAIQLAFIINHCRDRAFACHGISLEAFRYFRNIIIVAHPANILAFNTFKQGTIGLQFHGSLTEFADTSTFNMSTQSMCHELMSIANAKNRYTQLKNTGINFRSFFSIYAVWSTCKNYTFWIFCLDLFKSIGIRDNFAVNSAFSNSSGNQLIILAAEVNNQYKFVLHFFHIFAEPP